METYEDSLGRRGATTHIHAPHAHTHTLHGSQGIAANESLVHPCAYSHHCVPETWMNPRTHTNIGTCRETDGSLVDINPTNSLVMQI